MLRSDIIRLEVLKNEDIFDNKVASNMNKRTQVYDEVFRLADEYLKGEKAIILDATFVTQELRNGQRQLPRNIIYPLLFCKQTVLRRFPYIESPNALKKSMNQTLLPKKLI